MATGSARAADGSEKRRLGLAVSGRQTPSPDTADHEAAENAQERADEGSWTRVDPTWDRRDPTRNRLGVVLVDLVDEDR